MARTEYRYALELTTEEGAPLGRFPARVDWSPAIEWARFAATRRGKLAPVMAAGRSEVRPLWHPKYENPYVGGFNVTVFGENLEPISTEIPTTYFRGPAKQA